MWTCKTCNKEIKLTDKLMDLQLEIGDFDRCYNCQMRALQQFDEEEARKMRKKKKTSEPKVILKPKKNNSQIGCVAGLLPLIGFFLAIFAIHSAGNGIVQLLESLPWPLFILFTCGGMFICLKIFGSK
tara:strand:- start:647 stop:1030 length:384 start_codon:yes stop_codon:yes gene_type:complete